MRQLARMVALLALVLAEVSSPISVHAAVLASQSDASVSDTKNPFNGLIFQPNVLTTGSSSIAVYQVGVFLYGNDPGNYWHTSFTNADCSFISGNEDAYIGFIKPGMTLFRAERFNGNLRCDFDSKTHYFRIYTGDLNPLIILEPNTTYNLFGMRTEFSSYDIGSGHETVIYGSAIQGAGACYHSNLGEPVSDCDAGASPQLRSIGYFIAGDLVSTPFPTSTTTGPSSVLFIPGIEGSRLYQTKGGNEERIWEPNVTTQAADLELTQSGRSVRTDVYTRDVLDTAYGTDIYNSFLVSLDEQKAAGRIFDWEAIPYDWRLSLIDILTYGAKTGNGISYSSEISTTTPYVVQELRRLAAEAPSHKVTIIAHSNGGLVAKELIRLLGPEASDLIDQIIFVAVPQAGTPQAIAGLLHGQDAGLPSFFPVIFSATNARKVGNSSPTLYNLLPSANYFTYVDTPVITIDPVSMPDWVAKYGSTIHSEVALRTFLIDTYQRVSSSSPVLETPVALNGSLLTEAEAVHTVQDAWVPPSGIHLTQIAGWGVPKTIASLKYSRRGGIIHVEPQFVVDGDGTVVTPSALWTPASSSVENYYFNLGQYNKDHENAVQEITTLWDKNHGNIFSVPEMVAALEGLVASSSSSILSTIPYISRTLPNSTDKRLQYSLHSPLSLNLFDNEGRHTGISTTTGQLEEQIPGTYYLELSEVKYLLAEEGISQNLVLNGYANGSFTLNIDEYSGNTLMASTTFRDIPTTSSTSVKLTTDSDISAFSALSIDKNGDGMTDLMLVPKLNDVVTLPTDTNPPEMKIALDSITHSLILEGHDQESGTSTQLLVNAATSSRITDTAGHSLTIMYSKNEQTKDHAFLTISSFAYDLQTASSTTGLIRYYWIAPKIGPPTIVLAHLRTKESSILALYLASTKKTIILSAFPADDSMDPAAIVASIALRPRPIIKQYSGLVIPFMTSDRGKLKLSY